MLKICYFDEGFTPNFVSNINSFMTEAVIICSANQWTGFYMITVPVMKELSEFERMN